MSIITFWNPEREQTGVTMSVVATATKMAIERNLKVLVVSTAYKDMTIKNDIGSFVEIHKVHSANQKYYILNVVDLLKEYNDKTVEIITKKATRKI